MDIRKELLGNIIIVGGNSLIPGFVEKFEKSLYEIAPQVFFFFLIEKLEHKGENFCFSEKF